MAINHRHFGVHEAFFVLKNTDAAFQCRRVKRLRCEAQQGMVGLALQQHGNLYPAPGCRLQGAAKTHAGQKVGVGNQDVVFRRIDGVNVGVQDVVAMADVVADLKSGNLRADRSAARRGERLKPEAALEIHPGDNLPKAPNRMMHLLHGRPFDTGRVVIARPHVGRGVVVIDDIDAADKSDSGIDHRQLAMEPAQAMPADMEAPDFGAVNHGANAGFRELGEKVRTEILPAKAVDRDIDLDATPGRTAKRRGDLMTDFVIGKNVAFEINFQRRRFDRGQQGGEVLAARIEQREPVARQKVSRHALPDGLIVRRDRKWLTTVNRGEPRFA